jgi:hypothetical protein
MLKWMYYHISGAVVGLLTVYLVNPEGTSELMELEITLLPALVASLIITTASALVRGRESGGGE